MIIARYAAEVFSSLESFYTNDFVEATKAHLVPAAFEEIYIFRGFMKVLDLKPSYSIDFFHTAGVPNFENRI